MLSVTSLPGTGGFVVFPVLIVALRASVNVSQHDAHAFSPRSSFFVATFHAEFSDEVAALIIIIVGNVFVVHFSDIAEKVRPKASGVVANGAFSTEKPLKRKSFSRKTENSSAGIWLMKSCGV